MENAHLLYQHLYATERWEKVRVWALERSRYRCQECGYTKDMECVHEVPMELLIKSLQRKGQGNRVDEWQVEQLFFDSYRLEILCKRCLDARDSFQYSRRLAEQGIFGII